MPSQMTLTLKLNGITSVINNIKKLNQAINLLNKNFNIMGQGIGNIANTMKSINQSAKQIQKPPVIKSPRSGRPGSKFQNFGNNPIHDWFSSNNSILYSLLSGGPGSRRFQAKMGIRAINSLTSTHSSGPPPVIGSFGEMLGKLGKIFTVAFVAVKATVAYLKMWAEAIKWSTGILKEHAKFFWGTGGNQRNAGALYGVAKALDLPLDKVASDAAGQPGMGVGLIAKLRALYGMRGNTEGASFYANQEGLTDYLPLLDKNPDEFNKALSDKGNGFDPKSRAQSVRFSSAMGELKHAWDDLAISMTPLIEIATRVIKAIKAIIDGLVKFGEYLMNIYKLILSMLGVNVGGETPMDGVNKALGNAANALNNAANNFTNKVGTYGGGERAQGLIPRGYTSQQNQRRLINNAENLGAFQF